MNKFFKALGAFVFVGATLAAIVPAEETKSIDTSDTTEETRTIEEVTETD